jgi:hypothetical protein
MLNLKLRDEFLGSQMPGTAIELRRGDNKGAAQQGPEYILGITYPTADVQTALKQIGAARAGRPIVLMGDRGRGKSHIMAVMHHAIQSPDKVEAWVHEWGASASVQVLRDLKLDRGFVAISEPVHNHEFPLLWDLLFARHPKGDFFRGKFEQMKQPYPPRSLLEEMFKAQPVALILDEFQKWFDGLHDDPAPTGRKWRECASNFIQNLSEIAKDRPDTLILVVSVLNNNTEAFRQVHRNEPVVVDFRGPTAKQDRQRLVLHRLFANRSNIPIADITALVSSYAQERFRLRFSHLSDAERGRIAGEVVQAWPFAPELGELLEEQILMAEAAQETRDLIRILAQAYRARGEAVPLITPADFFVDEDSCGVQSLLDSIATVGEQEKLREIAQSNLAIVQACGEPIPHAKELISALWMRSMSPGRDAGGTRQELQLDITRQTPQDDNAFQVELSHLIDNSRNIHGEERPDGRLHFEIGENPRSMVRATARNDKLWQVSAGTPVIGQTTYPGEDLKHVRNTLRHMLMPEARDTVSRIIVLGPKWDSDPWSEAEETDAPNRWDRPVLLVMPSPLAASGKGVVAGLGRWLAKHVPAKRNVIRFLLAAADAKGIYEDDELRMLARCSYLTSIAWKDEPRYRALSREFDTPLRDKLKERFDRFAVLKRWDFPNPDDCRFEVERVGAKGGEIPAKVEELLVKRLYDPTEFQKLVLAYAAKSATAGDILDEIVEAPGAPDKDAMAYLGDTQTCEEILKVAAKGKIILNVDGTWVSRLPEHADEDDALRFIRARAFRSGQDMRRVQLGLPGAAAGSAVSGPRAAGAGAGTTTSTSAQPGAGQPGSVPPGGLFGGSGGATGGTVIAGGTGTAVVGGGTTPGAAPIAKTQRADEPQLAINLAGCFERWGIDAGTTLTSAKIEFRNVNAQQVKQILQRLPSSLKASLEVSYNEEAQS